MRTVFMGTPATAATILETLAAHHDVVGAFTRPDAVRGRGSKLEASPVKKAALKLGIPVFTPSSFADDGALAELESLAPDVICVSAYGIILPKSVLDLPACGCLNVHASLLPRWRGAAPVERAILAGDERTGVCIMLMEEGLDTGPFCVRREIAIQGDSAPDLAARLADEGALALLEALEAAESERIAWTPQPHEGMVYANKIAKGELNPALDDTPEQFAAKVRASSVGHPSRACVAGRNLAIEQVQGVGDEAGREACGQLGAGEVLFAMKRLFLGVSNGAVELLQVKPDGKKSMDAKSFAGGIQGIKGTILTWRAFA